MLHSYIGEYHGPNSGHLTALVSFQSQRELHPDRVQKIVLFIKHRVVRQGTPL